MWFDEDGCVVYFGGVVGDKFCIFGVVCFGIEDMGDEMVYGCFVGVVDIVGLVEIDGFEVGF